jgi:ankyrin repeat protein
MANRESDYDGDEGGLYDPIPNPEPNTDPDLELWIAALYNNKRRIQELLDQFPNININFQIDGNPGIDHDCSYILLKGTTPLMVAVLRSKLDVIKLLIEHGAQINQQCSNGYTALHYAVQENLIQYVKLLLKNKAFTSLVNNYKKSPYQMVIDRKSICYGDYCKRKNCAEENHPYIIMKKLFDRYRVI